MPSINAIDKKYRPLEILMTLMLFIFALRYDSIHFPRTYYFIFGFLGFVGLIVLRMQTDKVALTRGSYLASVFLVMLLEHNSRYIINYFIHVLYVLLIIEMAVAVRKRSDLWVGMVVICAGMYKYVNLIQYRPAISTYAEATFFMLLNIMSLVVIALMLGLREEQDKLIKANNKLEAYSKEVQKLTEVMTRADIASRIHDGVGHNLTALIMQLEMTSHLFEKSPNQAREQLERAKETARDNLVKVRQAVKTMDGGSTGHDIETLIREFSNKTGLKISWEIDHKLLNDSSQKECVYRAIQEAMTNALRHGKASEMWIQLKVSHDKENFFDLVIRDNGTIEKIPDPGYGIGKMTQRFESLDGAVEFEIESGLIVKGSLPIKPKGAENRD